MQAFSSYLIAILGNPDKVKQSIEFLANEINDEIQVQSITAVDENYEVVWIEDLIDMVTRLAQEMPTISFVVKGLIDCSASCGECMPFAFVYQNRMLSIYHSNWVYYNQEIEDIYDCLIVDDYCEDCSEIFLEELVEEIQSENWDNIDSIEI